MGDAKRGEARLPVPVVHRDGGQHVRPGGAHQRRASRDEPSSCHWRGFHAGQDLHEGGLEHVCKDNGAPTVWFDGRGRIRKENLDKFNSGMSKILVATDSMEEGIDIQACNVVISFDKFHNIKSHIQRAGRARDASAAIFYFENDPDKAIRDASVMSGVARSATGPAAVADSINLDYIHPNTEAHVTPTNCFNILHEYVQKVLRKTVHTADIFTETDTGMVCRYPTPCGFTTLDSACLDAEDPSLSTFRAALQQERWNHQTSLQRWLAFLAVSRLTREGFIGEDNMPTARALETDPCSDVFGFASHERAGTSSVETSSTAPRGSGCAVSVHLESPIHQASVEMPVPNTVSQARAWCREHDLPDVLATALEHELVKSPIDLVGLCEQDLEVLCQGCLLGQKGKFKRLVMEMRADVVAPVGTS